jgi:hypothetical protein
MKKLFTFLLILIGLMAHAQDNKPTKEETIEFIESYFKQEYFTTGDFKCGYELKRLGGWRDLICKIQGVSIVNNNLIFSYSITTKNLIPNLTTTDVEYFTNNINLNKVESIIFSGIGGDPYIYGLAFHEKNNPNSEKPYLPFIIVGSGDSKELKETQIYKAFEHLRKLCGAPEPLKF